MSGVLSRLFKGGSGVSPQEAASLMPEGVLMIDVREPGEWKAGHVAGSVNVPLGQLARRVGELPPRAIVVCQSGARSARGAALLRRASIDAMNLRGGMHAWAAAGLPVERGGKRR